MIQRTSACLLFGLVVSQLFTVGSPQHVIGYIFAMLLTIYYVKKTEEYKKGCARK